MVLVTIGIPVYNGEKFIGKCIESILNQTYQDFELIITDDGSTDATVEIIRNFEDKRIKLIAEGYNKGISYRLNQQIELAQGKYFVRMDADDIMFPDRIEKQVNFLQNNADIDAVGSSVVVLDDDDQIIAFRKSVLLSDYKKLFRHILFNHPTVTGKIEFFRKYLYAPDLVGVEDADLWIRSFPDSKFHIMEEPLVFYRDPLVFKLKTYKFRINQKNKLIKKSQYLNKYYFFKQRLLIENNGKKVIATILSALKLDKFLISKRNSGNIKIDHKWVEILNNITHAR